MNQIQCWQHPKYKGSQSPALSCPNCCEIFIHKILRENEDTSPAESKNFKEKILDKRKKKIEHGTRHWLTVK